MTTSDLKFTVRERQWFIVSRSDATIEHGPYATSGEAIKARQDLARVDVTATAEKVSRKQQAQRDREEAGV